MNRFERKIGEMKISTSEYLPDNIILLQNSKGELIGLIDLEKDQVVPLSAEHLTVSENYYDELLVKIKEAKGDE